MQYKIALVTATALATLPTSAFAQDVINPAPVTPSTAAQDRPMQLAVTQNRTAPVATETAAQATTQAAAAQYNTMQDDDDDIEAPDGTPAFGFEPYVAIGGGYEVFDRGDELAETGLTDPTEGALINGIVGANVPLGPVFVGAEGFGSYGFGDIDWEYGAAGRFGVRVGDSGLFFGRVGYMWIEGENDADDEFVDTDEGPSNRDRDGMIYGIGVEVGPKDIGLGGITSNSGVRLRLGVDTFGDFESFRPNAAVVVHF